MAAGRPLATKPLDQLVGRRESRCV